MQIAPHTIVENLAAYPKTMGLLRRFAKEQGVSIHQSFSGTLQERRIALLADQNYKKQKLSLNKDMPMNKMAPKLTKVLEDYFNE